MAQSVANSRCPSGGLLQGNPRIVRLVACLAVLDLSIWSYVAVAIHVPATSSPRPVTVAFQSLQP
jgi:hypothetical protein